MSLLLKERVYTMESPTAKRGVYPLHGYKLGLYRLPIKLDDPAEMKSIHDGLKNTFEMDMYADRIFATYTWSEENMPDKFSKDYEKVDLSITVEIVSGEVVDIIYQIFPLDKFGDPQWITDYRKKADHFAKMIIDTILRNTILSDKMVESLIKTETISEDQALIRLEELTPLAQIVPDAKPKPVEEKVEVATSGDIKNEIKRDGNEPVDGPIEAGTKGAILYSTFVPCLECTKMAITIGIKKFVCLDEYPETNYELIKEAGVIIELIDRNKIESWAKMILSKDD